MAISYHYSDGYKREYLSIKTRIYDVLTSLMVEAVPAAPLQKTPSYFPSPIYNKCTNKLCHYPNPPQAAGGNYACTSPRKWWPCKGVYFVSELKAAVSQTAIEEAHFQRKLERQRAAEADRKSYIAAEVIQQAAEQMRGWREQKAVCESILLAEELDDWAFKQQYAARWGLQDRLKDTYRWRLHLDHVRQNRDILSSSIFESIDAFGYSVLASSELFHVNEKEIILKC